MRVSRIDRRCTAAHQDGESGFDVEVRIGVQNVAREITFETTLTADELVAAVKAARGSDVLELIDDKGGRVIVPTESIGYVTTGAEKKGGVGFGAH